MEIFNFAVLFAAFATQNFLTPHISKTYLPICLLFHLLYFELMLKRPVKKKVKPLLYWGGGLNN